MLAELCSGADVYIITGFTDMRKGIDGLAAIIQGMYSLDPFSKQLFLFCGHNRSKIKGLLWENDGFLMLYKRLDNGVFRWPRTVNEAKLISPQQVRWLLEGLEIEQPKAVKEAHHRIVY